MAVDNPDTVNIVSEGDRGSLVLTITDHLDWSDSLSHQGILQAKINCYLAYIESGQMLQNFPESAGKEVVIRVLAMSQPDDAGVQFLDRAAQALTQAGYQFLWREFT